MNKKGHVAVAVLAGSAVAMQSTSFSVTPTIFLVLAAGVAGLLPDLDHKTSTVSNAMQFSAKVRRRLRGISALTIVVGLALFYLQRGLPLLWIGSGLCLAAVANLRTLILGGAGLMLIGAYLHFHEHWLFLLVGIALLVMPFVKHRGIIHSPEFAALLSLGVLSFSDSNSQIVEAVGLGILTGWWSHLVGDAVTSEGIHSVVIPRLKVALNVLKNGGAAERWIARSCWAVSVVLWINLFNK